MNTQTLSLLERVLRTLEESRDDVATAIHLLPDYKMDIARRVAAATAKLQEHEACIDLVAAAIAAERRRIESAMPTGDKSAENSVEVKLPTFFSCVYPNKFQVFMRREDNVPELVLTEQLPECDCAERSKEQAKPLHTSKTYPDDGGSVIVYEGGVGYPAPTPEMLNGDPLFDAIWNAIKYWDISRDNDGMYSSPSGNDVRHIYDTIKQAKSQQEPYGLKLVRDRIAYLKRQSGNGAHMNIPSSLSARACWEFAMELERFLSVLPQSLKPLSDEEIEALGNEDRFWHDSFSHRIFDWFEFARAIETKLGVWK